MGKVKKYIYKYEMQLSANTFSQVGIPQIYEKKFSNCVNCMKQEKHSLTNILQTVNRLKKKLFDSLPIFFSLCITRWRCRPDAC